MISSSLASLPSPIPYNKSQQKAVGSSSGQLAGGSSRTLLRRRRPLHHRTLDEVSEKVLDAAALQDSLIGRMKLDLGVQAPRAVVVLGGNGAERGGTRRRRGGGVVAKGRQPDENADNAPVSTAAAIGRTGGTSTAWTCQSCSADNCTNGDVTRSDGHNSSSSGGNACYLCCQPRQQERRLPAVETEYRSFDDREGNGTGASGGCSEKGQEEKHHHQRRLTVTLAQIRGLEEPPEPTLTPGEWRCENKRRKKTQSGCAHSRCNVVSTLIC